MKKKVGRSPIGEKALTAVQKTQRQRKKQALKIEVAKNSGFIPTAVLLSKNQLESLSGLLYLAVGEQVAIDSRRLNDVIFHGIKLYLQGLEKDCLDRCGYSPELVKTHAYSDEDGIDYNKLFHIESEAQRLFKDWEQQQAEGGNGE